MATGNRLQRAAIKHFITKRLWRSCNSNNFKRMSQKTIELIVNQNKNRHYNFARLMPFIAYCLPLAVHFNEQSFSNRSLPGTPFGMNKVSG